MRIPSMSASNESIEAAEVRNARRTGLYNVLVRSSSQAIRLKGSFMLKESTDV
jgi:hypothetical protein